MNTEPFEDTLLYFGHQSVGRGILRGLEEHYPSVVRWKEDQALPVSGLTIHNAFLGSNGRPFDKLKDFRNRILGWTGDAAPDYAGMKFCYLDITSDTDTDALFAAYTAVVDEVETTHPDLTVIHFTVPLTTNDPALRAAVKRMLGREPWGREHNRRREEYNDRMREAYAEGGRLYDVAALEASRGSDRNPSLDRRLTDDGGHLNAEGRRYLASEFLDFFRGVAASETDG